MHIGVFVYWLVSTHTTVVEEMNGIKPKTDEFSVAK